MKTANEMSQGDRVELLDGTGREGIVTYTSGGSIWVMVDGDEDERSFCYSIFDVRFA